jgi:DNA-binding MarR family transcriptional regulator
MLRFIGLIVKELDQMTDPHTGRLLRDAFAAFERELLHGLHAADADALRATHQAVLRFLDVETGTRASTLAERAGLTRQALTQIVDDLERLGYVVRRPDPEDRRAKLVVYTDKGRATFEVARRIIEGIERDWRERLGAAAYESLRASLLLLGRDH